ncbi:MAG: nitric-oxide reductase large subunit, partial [Candidatus Thiodiazotropha sp. (ex Dulcina madagascariensis)]|nr:nitric-oxide reductase large subunit [Candidatus Thiodiazotropha sp. (ex Dulcina madagascariensis)]MCU7937368.1 nitric-oxide reductase large subunit [Candidatus Thiodiazotropha sp. (ex Dulcina madagascariensis)]
QRFSDTPLSFLVVQDKIALFYWLRLVAGVTFLGGLAVYIWSFFIPGERRASDMPAMEAQGSERGAVEAAAG